MLPASSDDVCITGFNVAISAGTHSVNSLFVGSGSSLALTGGTLDLAASSQIDGSLILSAGVLGGAGLLTVNGATMWTGGIMTGSGRTRTVGGLQINGVAYLHGGRILETPAGSTTTMTAELMLPYISAATIENYGLWDIPNDSDLTIGNELYSSGVFKNMAGGTFRKSGGAATTSNVWIFDNAGSVQIQSGRFVPKDGTQTGSFSVSGGATLELTSGTMNFNAGSSITGPGTVSFTTGTTNFNTGSSYALAGLTTLTGTGVVNFNTGSTATPNNFVMSGGTLGGTGTVNIGGLATWTGGIMTGSGRTRTVGGLQINGVAYLHGGRILETPAGSTTTMTAELMLPYISAATIENYGLWDIPNDSDLTIGNELYSSGVFKNMATGTFRKSGGAATTSNVWTTSNAGTLETRSGTLSITAYTQTAGVTRLNGGILAFLTPAQIQGGRFEGEGTVSGSAVNSGGLLTPGFSPGILSFSGAYTQGASAAFNMEIGGLAPGAGHDEVHLTGSAAASLSGTLNVTLIGGFVPADGDVFTIMTFPSRTGTFSTVNLPPLPAPLGWTVTYGPTWAILGAGAVCGNGGSVVSFSPGTGTNSTSAATALGPPDGEAVPLGLNGVLVLAMSSPIVDRTGVDFVVHENGVSDGAINENFRVEASADGVLFRLVADCPGDSCSLDLGLSGLTSASFLRITDLPPQEPGSTPPNLGADIDAVEVLHCSSPEICDGFDNDGNNAIDEGCDDDGDDYCDASMGVVGFPAVCPHGGGDCADSEVTIHPGVAEICDYVDNNCNNSADEGFPNVTWYRDQDGDGHGNPNNLRTDCHVSVPCYVTGPADDCDDARSDRYPGNSEICDGIDNDCDGDADAADSDGIDNPWADTDGDGLYDCWEVYGVDSDVTTPGVPSAQEVDLPLNQDPYNASRLTPDIFVELDYMENLLHSHRPVESALVRITDAFRLHGRNSQGVHTGITLHWFVDEPVSDINAIDLAGLNEFQYGVNQQAEPTDPTIACTNVGAHFGTSGERQDTPRCPGIMRARSWVFRYGLVAHGHVNGTGGESRHPIFNQNECASTGFFTAGVGFDRYAWVISRWADSEFDPEFIDQQGGILMHELGHTLGLGHGGLSDANCKPNYLSVMSYARQFNNSGVARNVGGVTDGESIRTNRELNYSDQELDQLDETMLNEGAGIGGPMNQRVLYGVQGVAYVGPSEAEIDWNNQNGIENPVAGSPNINAIASIGECGGGANETSGGNPTSILIGHDDWRRIAMWPASGSRGLGCMQLPSAPRHPPARVLTSPVDGTITPQAELSAADYLDGGLGSADYDGDGVGNSSDDCPVIADPQQADLDADTYGDLCDCLPLDATAWAAPSEAIKLTFNTSQSLAWRKPLFPGGTMVTYDTIRSTTPDTFIAASCLESNDGTDTEATDTAAPMPGQLFFYLIRAKSNCPNGYGSLGRRSSGAPRVGVECN